MTSDETGPTGHQERL